MLGWFAPVVPTKVVVGNPGHRKRLIYVFEDLPAPDGEPAAGAVRGAGARLRARRHPRLTRRLRRQLALERARRLGRAAGPLAGLGDDHPDQDQRRADQLDRARGPRRGRPRRASR